LLPTSTTAAGAREVVVHSDQRGVRHHHAEVRAEDLHQQGRPANGSVLFASRPIIPTFAFIDPYGYKGLSLGLVHAVLKDWACECLFFLNYNRINAGIQQTTRWPLTWTPCSVPRAWRRCGRQSSACHG
jgi:three-Cys-motif partner protein